MLTRLPSVILIIIVVVVVLVVLAQNGVFEGGGDDNNNNSKRSIDLTTLPIHNTVPVDTGDLPHVFKDTMARTIQSAKFRRSLTES